MIDLKRRTDTNPMYGVPERIRLDLPSIYAGKARQRAASKAGRLARFEWQRDNGHRLVRVFAVGRGGAK